MCCAQLMIVSIWNWDWISNPSLQRLRLWFGSNLSCFFFYEILCGLLSNSKVLCKTFQLFFIAFFMIKMFFKAGNFHTEYLLNKFIWLFVKHKRISFYHEIYLILISSLVCGVDISQRRLFWCLTLIIFFWQT